MTEAGRHQRQRSPTQEVVGRRVASGVRTYDDFTYSVIESTVRGERRGERRIPSHLREGTVGESRGRCIAECRIRELSRRGARLQLERERPLPKSFVLREAGSQRSFIATLIWQTGRDAGVRLAQIEAP